MGSQQASMFSGRLGLRDTSIRLHGLQVYCAEDSSSMHLLDVQGEMAGGLSVDSVELKRSRLTIQHARAVQDFAAVFSKRAIFVTEGSMVRISDAHASKKKSSTAAMFTSEGLVVAGGSSVHIERATAANNPGIRAASIVVADGSLLRISKTHALGESLGGTGAFAVEGSLQVLNTSTVRIEDTTALDFAGGFWSGSGVVVSDGSLLFLRNTTTPIGAGGFFTLGAVEVSGKSNISISHAASGETGGGFMCDKGVRIMGGSMVEISEATSDDQGGGFATNGAVVVSDGSFLRVSGARAESHGGGFYAMGDVIVSKGSTVWIDNAASGADGGGFHARGLVEVSRQSLLNISSTAATLSGGGFMARSAFRLAAARVLVANSSAGEHGGGFFCVGDALISQGSSLKLAHCASGSQGGGFQAEAAARVVDDSAVDIEDSKAVAGGGFGSVGPVEINASRLQLFRVSAEQDGGGFHVKDLFLVNGSKLHIDQATAGGHGGGFGADDVTVLASNVTIENVAAVSGSGAGINAQQALRIAGGSVVSIWNATAGLDGAGILAMLSSSIQDLAEVSIAYAFAGERGGCFWSGQLELSHSRLVASQCSSRDGGGFRTESASLTRAHLSILGGAERGGGFFVERSMEASDSELWVAGWHGQRGQRGSMTQQAADAALGSGAFLQGPLRLTRSALHLQNLQGRTALVSRCLELSQSLVVVNATTAVGISLQNAACSCGRALRVDGALVGSGISSALLSVDPCGDETLAVTDVWLQTSRAAVAETTAHTRVRNVTVEYLEPLDAAVLLNAPSFDVESAKVSCAACTDGVTFGVADGFGLQVVSASWLRCGSEAALNDSSTQRCGCVPPQVPDKSSFGDYVKPWETRDYCVYCPPNFESHDDDDDCHKCPLHKADLTMVSKHNRTQLCVPCTYRDASSFMVTAVRCPPS